MRGHLKSHSTLLLDCADSLAAAQHRSPPKILLQRCTECSQYLGSLSTVLKRALLGLADCLFQTSGSTHPPGMTRHRIAVGEEESATEHFEASRCFPKLLREGGLEV